MSKYIIVVLLCMVIAIFIALKWNLAETDKLNGEKQRLKTEIHLLSRQNDSLLLQIEARNILINKLNASADSLIKINRKNRLANHEKIEFIRNASAAEQLRIFTERNSSR